MKLTRGTTYRRLSKQAATVQVDALAALCDGGWIDIYSGERPPSPDDPAPRGAAMLASLRFARRAFEPGVDGVTRANAIESDVDAVATGRMTWYRVTGDDHRTPVMDGSIGTATDDPSVDMIMKVDAIQQHAEVSLRAFVLSVPTGARETN